MAQLIRNIQGNPLKYVAGDVTFLSSILGEIQQDDYVNLHGYTALMQNLTKTEYTQSLVMPLKFGLSNPVNTPMLTLQIDY